MHVLHLIDPGHDFNGPMPLALAAAGIGRLQGISDATWLWGSSQLKQDAHTAGLRNCQFVSTPMGDPMLLAPRLRALLRAQPQDKGTLVECWSPRMFQVVRILAPNLTRILRVTRPLSVKELKLTRATLASDATPSTIVAISATLRHHLISYGIPSDRTVTLPPGIDLSLHQPGLRTKIRQAWGIQGENIIVVGVIGDPPRLVDAYDASMATGLTEVSQTRKTTLGAGVSGVTDPAHRYYRTLFHPHQERLSNAVTTARQFRDISTILQDANVDAPWLTLPGCDVAIAIGPHASGLGLLHAMASGVPIAAEATRPNCEALEDQHNSLLSKPDWLQGISHNILRILGNPDLAWKLKENARQDIYSTYSRSTYCTRLSRLYHALHAGALPTQSDITPDLVATPV
jgi:glycosyltransferase involved in cell wall biosynthesis